MSIHKPASHFERARRAVGRGLGYRESDGRPARRIDGRQRAIVQKKAIEDEVLQRILPWAGDARSALRWYRTFPIASLGDVTAFAMVKSGRADLVHDYLDRIAEGGFA